MICVYIYIIILILICLCFYWYFQNIHNNNDNKYNNNLDFFTKWIDDKKDLLNIYGREYLLKLTYPHFSKISKLPNDIKLYPQIMNAKVTKIILNKGDSLFIPAGWWHYITSYNRNVAINYWYIPYNKDVSNVEWRKNCHRINSLDEINSNNLNSLIFDKYVKKSEPLIIKYSHVNSDAFKKWKSNDYLTEIISNTKIYYYKFPKSDFWNSKWRKSKNNKLISGTFLDLINLCLQDKDNYYYLARNYEVTKILNKDYNNFDFTSNMELALTNFWFNYGYINCPLHYDMFDNILTQIDGYKEIYLFSPSDDKYLYLDDNKL